MKIFPWAPVRSTWEKFPRTSRLEGVSETAEEIMAAREILLANETRIPVHLAHQSTPASVHMIRLAKQLGVPVSAETCPHYLMLDETELYSQNANFKMNPPLRTKKDVEEVKRGFMDGTIDILVTDHAPHSKEEKALPLDKAPNGIIGLQTSFAATRTALPEMPLMDLIAKMTINPAQTL